MEPAPAQPPYQTMKQSASLNPCTLLITLNPDGIFPFPALFLLTPGRLLYIIPALALLRVSSPPVQKGDLRVLSPALIGANPTFM